MIDKVSLLDVLSHTVKLELKSVEDGITNGKREMPAVPITPIIAKEEPMNASNVLPFTMHISPTIVAK